MELEKLFFNIFDKLHRLGFRSDESLVNFLAFLVRQQIIAKNLKKNSLATQILEEFHYHTNNQILKKIEEILVSVDYSSITSEELRDSFNFLINKFSLNDKRRGEFFTPPSVTNLAINFANPKPNQIIFDPTCGIGSFFVELNKRFPSYNLRFIGQEINSQSRFLCLINLFANEIFNAQVYLGNSLENIHFEEQGKIDIALANLPLEIRFPINRTSETEFIELMLSSTKKDGKVIVVVPESFFFTSLIAPFRRTLLENDWIERVISLSQDAFGHFLHIKASIIVFNKDKADKGFIIFDGKEDRFEETRININEILLTQNYNLQASRYALKEAKELKSILSTSPFEIVKLKDLIYSSISGANYLSANQIIENSSEELPFVRVVDLAKNEDEFDFDISKVERKISRAKARRNTVIDFSVVLVSKIVPKLKPTYFNFTGQPIVIGSDIIALKMKADVNVEYFLTQLHSRLVKIQVEMMSSGTTMNRISTEDFLNIQILLPSLEEQTKQAIEFLKKTQKGLVEDVAEVEKEVKNTEYDIIRIAIHDFNQKLGAMQNDLSDLKKFFEEKLPNYLSEPIKPVFDDDTEEEINQFRLGNVLQRLINTRNEAFEQLSATREEVQNNTVKPILIENLKKWFEKEVKPLYQHNIDFEVNGEKVEVEIDPARFKTLVRNLIVNAKQHNAKVVAFDVSYSFLDGEKKVRILYKNDGESFPEDFDFNLHFKRLYQKSAESKGTGIGGYSVNKTVELHNGEMKNVSPERNSFDLFPVQIEILLPIEYKPNPNYVKSNPYSLN